MIDHHKLTALGILTATMMVGCGGLGGIIGQAGSSQDGDGSGGATAAPGLAGTWNGTVTLQAVTITNGMREDKSGQSQLPLEFDAQGRLMLSITRAPTTITEVGQTWKYSEGGSNVATATVRELSVSEQRVRCVLDITAEGFSRTDFNSDSMTRTSRMTIDMVREGAGFNTTMTVVADEVRGTRFGGDFIKDQTHTAMSMTGMLYKQ